ncbi:MULTISPECIES: ABC transporter substrate-binding protein [Bradyrhizobium]|uniref:ABC transport system substrate-binding protein n=1 Tax=Bradyrhizobium ottawaense TaxID=931866 RepID=A0A2U8P7D3_9BRAD|nr:MULTISPECIES: ABC transporter substrate-binding protein [Bradyrhizobium]AWL93656.1 ABC transporter substrate-binding protein [Bradyrhizobium ottawaense]MBR1290757.1 ABC transporter substrate-binding protein [Bradyrhizobium ottawaense]MBR1330466.1 ABC transporter substrate-binding protein [Bradyrhizobium ottawaense]MBR1336732.1 ABC transporter substrate-binding protein [Bradyrhizobium ottawaense]MBR1361022.1 ABC transporter substrate-binding protein [Bradyrhizobium ottawaense]
MNRRECLAFLGMIAALPVPVLAQQPNAARRLGVLSVTAADDAIGQTRSMVLVKALAGHGLKERDNLKIDWRSGGGDRARIAQLADELIALRPDVLLAVGTPSVEELRQRTTTIPIVFAVVTDPVSQGFVENLAHPGGNVTGFTDYDGPLAGKWLEMLTQVTPKVSRVVVVYNPATAPFAPLMLRTIEDAARTLQVAVEPAPVHDAASIAALGLRKDGGLLVLPDFFTMANRGGLLAAIAQARVPAVFWSRTFVEEGGLMSYSTDSAEQLRRAADYIDRILKGARPADLPVQNPTKFELAVNLKAARECGVTLHPGLIALANDVIE